MRHSGVTLASSWTAPRGGGVVAAAVAAPRPAPTPAGASAGITNASISPG